MTDAQIVSPDSKSPPAGDLVSLSEALRRAVALHNHGQADAAASIYHQILAAKPNQTDALHLLGVLHLQAGRRDEAMPLLERAAEQAPRSDIVLGNYALALDACGRTADARRVFERVLALKPDNAGAHSNLAGIYQRHGDYPAALAEYMAALRVDPNFADGYFNLGSLHLEHAEADAALAAYERALHIKPDHGRYRWNRAWCLLLLGRLREGFAEYEGRWANPDFTVFQRRPNAAQWTGEEIHRKSLLLWAEQGLGDSLQFIRYIPMVRERLGPTVRIVVECDDLVAPLFRELPGVDAVSRRGDPTPAGIDAHCALMSLPHVLRTDLHTIPAEIPYLHALPERRAVHDRVASLRGRKIGLVWAGNELNSRDARRSLPLAKLAALPTHGEVTYVSLQKGERARRELGAFGGSLPMIDIADQLDDFADTASAIAACDLVIAVDTAVAHLAGAMGKPVWLLLQYSPDWRWMLARSDSPWYPTLRLFRQAQLDDWDSVVGSVAVALQGWLGRNDAG